MHSIPRKPLRVSTFDLDDEQPTTQPYPIALAFEESVNKFKELYVALASKDCKVVNQFSISRVGDEYGRLGVWGRNSGADRKGRSSLDDILHNDPDLNSIILDILKDLCEDLGFGMYSFGGSSSVRQLTLDPLTSSNASSRWQGGPSIY
jgi:hypothetical protein